MSKARPARVQFTACRTPCAIAQGCSQAGGSSSKCHTPGNPGQTPGPTLTAITPGSKSELKKQEGNTAAGLKLG